MRSPLPKGCGIFAGGDTEYVSFYVQVPDLEARLKQAEKLGAKVIAPPHDACQPSLCRESCQNSHIRSVLGCQTTM